jgi:hypothetical protein
MRKLLFLPILLLCFISTYAQKAPTWTNYVDRTAEFPESTYLLGYLAENNFNDEPEENILKRLNGHAKDQLVENILVDIQSISTLNLTNVNTDTHTEFKKSSSTVSNASIAGLTSKTYYDKRKSIGYAFAYAKKSDVISHYSNQIAIDVNKVKTQYEIAKNQIESGDNEKALKSLFQIRTTIKNIEQSQTMLITLSSNFDHSGIKRAEVNMFKIHIDTQLSAIRNNEQFSLSDAAFYIAYALNAQVEDKSKAIRVNNFTYQDTPMGSSFSRKFQKNIEQKLVQQGFTVANQDQENDQSFILNGTYWEEGDKLKISTLLRGQTNSGALASAECTIPKSTLQTNGISFTPENYKQAMLTMQQFAKDEVKGGNLKIDITTNRGKDNLIFAEGDPLKLFVRANRECYLRFVYHLADGSKVLLLDNYYINRDNVNKYYELPYTFECAEPFGAEVLQLNAQGDPFQPLNTKEEYGYEFILDDTQAIITKTRGFKKVKTSEEIKAEKRLSITTMTK